MAYRTPYAGEIRRVGLYPIGNGGLCMSEGRWVVGGVVLVFMNATGIQDFAGNHILTKTYYGSPLEVARAPQSSAQHSTMLALPLLIASPCQSAMKSIFGVICRVKSFLLWGLTRSCTLTGTDLQKAQVWCISSQDITFVW